MSIKFIPPKEFSDEGMIEVHLGPILHGYIEKNTIGIYYYYRIINGKAVPRHESSNLDELKQMIMEIA